MTTALVGAGLVAFALICIALTVRALKKRNCRRLTPTDPSTKLHGDPGQPVNPAAFTALVAAVPATQEAKGENGGEDSINPTAPANLAVRARTGPIEGAADSTADAGENNSGSYVHSAIAETDNRAAKLSSTDGQPRACDEMHAAESIGTPIEKSTDSADRPTISKEASATPIQPAGSATQPEEAPRIPVEPATRAPETHAHAEGETPGAESFHNNAHDSQAIHDEEDPRAPPGAAILDLLSSENAGQPVAGGRVSASNASSVGTEVNQTETVDPIQPKADVGNAPPRRTLRQFRPAPRAVQHARNGRAATGSRPAFDRALPIYVRLVFEKAGYCRISLLARKSSSHPDELAISGNSDPPPLVVLQDEWFQDYVPADAGQPLRQGVEWSGVPPNGDVARWSLSGREIYVLAPHPDLSGFVSTTRLVIGDEHVVLCTTERLPLVLEAIAGAGSRVPTVLNSGKGLPAGWVALRGVIPRIPVPANAEGDILNVLRPLAEVQIALEGGIRLARQAWLAGYPPRIRLRGDIQSAGAVRIDGVEATANASGSLSVPGWDQPGQHLVSCASASRTYVIQEGAEEWQGWDAYRWSMGDIETDAIASRCAICGAAVRPPSAVGLDHRRPLVIPVTNMVLIGPTPGDIEKCSARTDLPSAVSLVFPSFRPVWAIPAEPLRCDKRVARVELIGTPDLPDEDESDDRGSSSRSSDRENRRRKDVWIDLILDAGRKGLLTEPRRPDIAELWRAYRQHARKLRGHR